MWLRRDFTFDRFVRTPETSAAYRACVAVAQDAPRACRALLLHGPIGKTHLLHATGNAVLGGDPEARVACLTGEELLYGLVTALRRDQPFDLRDRYPQCQIIILDELAALRDRERTQEDIARILAACVGSGVRVVCAVTAPAQVRPLTAGLRALPRSRVVAIRQPSRDAIRRILKSIATSQGMYLPPMELTDIVRSCGRDVRRAIGLLNTRRLERSLAAHADK